ncbi:MAG TPA: class I SAM-dependent methyltransferase, partial [Prolixibacteraceae bacterium]|nr:class I SAM-dependent methyltransferase [Prolixibacteraceae bacterium]
MKQLQYALAASDYYYKVSHYYDEDANDFDVRYWSNPVLQQIRQEFRQEVKRFNAQNMLEIGCGTGLDLIHFSNIYPERNLFGIDISEQMIRLSQLRSEKNERTNIKLSQGSVEDIAIVFPGQQFDLIYVFFGALNTVENLAESAMSIKSVLNTEGILVVSFVNKWYLGGMLLELLRFRFSRAFGRIKPVWGGYSPTKFLPSHTYTPKEIKKAFEGYTLINCKGFSILHP